MPNLQTLIENLSRIPHMYITVNQSYSVNNKLINIPLFCYDCKNRTFLLFYNDEDLNKDYSLVTNAIKVLYSNNPDKDIRIYRMSDKRIMPEISISKKVLNCYNNHIRVPVSKNLETMLNFLYFLNR